MGLIDKLSHKKVVKEKTMAKVAKIASVIFYIAGLITFIVGFIRMKNIDLSSSQDVFIHLAILIWGMITLFLIGGLLELKSNIMKLEEEVENLKEK